MCLLRKINSGKKSRVINRTLAFLFSATSESALLLKPGLRRIGIEWGQTPISIPLSSPILSTCLWQMWPIFRSSCASPEEINKENYLLGKC
jgi:hypothetical protein